MAAHLIELGDLHVDEVRGVSTSTCVVRTARGVFALPRHCPHQGADLAYGWMSDGRLHCPWHNLPIDPETGAQPCASLGTLSVRGLEDVGAGRYRLPADLAD